MYPNHTSFSLITKIFIYKIYILSSLFINQVYAGEKEVNAEWCNKNNGVIEFRTKYGTYIDCLTENHAVESEYDYNWKEGIGQALHYAESVKKRAAILIIRREKTKKDYIYELKKTIEYHKLPITIFIVDE